MIDSFMMAFMGLDLEADKPIMNAELKLTMAETVTKIKLN